MRSLTWGMLCRMPSLMYVIDRYVGYSRGAEDAYTVGYESSRFDAVVSVPAQKGNKWPSFRAAISLIKDSTLTQNSRANYDFRRYLHVVRIIHNLWGFWKCIIILERCSLRKGVEGNPPEMKLYPNHKHHKINRGWQPYVLAPRLNVQGQEFPSVLLLPKGRGSELFRDPPQFMTPLYLRPNRPETHGLI